MTHITHKFVHKKAGASRVQDKSLILSANVRKTACLPPLRYANARFITISKDKNVHVPINKPEMISDPGKETFGIYMCFMLLMV